MRFTLLSLIILVSLSSDTLGQNKLIVDVVIDSLSGSRDDLFSKSKMFIAENWNSAQDVIQHDDREAGLILVKGINRVTVKENLGFVAVTHSFKHIAKFYHKDRKSRIVFEILPSSEVTSNPPASMGTWPRIKDINEPFQGIMTSGASKKAYAKIQQELASELRNTVKAYELYMRNLEVIDDGW